MNAGESFGELRAAEIAAAQRLATFEINDVTLGPGPKDMLISVLEQLHALSIIVADAHNDGNANPTIIARGLDAIQTLSALAAFAQQAVES